MVLAAALIVGMAAPAAASSAPSVSIVARTVDGQLVYDEVSAGAVETAIHALESDPDIAFAEVDVPVQAVADEPDDRYFRYQWGPVLTRATEVWDDPAAEARDVVVAVIDTGVDAGHPDLAGAVLPGLDLIGGGTGDPHGHGTQVAGVIASRGDNGIGIAGFCWTCSILPVRALDANGAGTSGTVASGVQWAADHGADVINLSLAGSRESQALATAIAYARARGAVVIAAAGNDGTAEPRYPAASAGVVGVVATAEDDHPYDWASRGGWADVAAPGCTVTTDTGSAYDHVCGSSLASPAVAGAVALALSRVPEATPAQVEAALMGTGVPVGALVAPHGRVDVAALVAAVAPVSAAPAVQRVAGGDRITTAAAISRRTHPSAATVVIARADVPADALLAAPVAGEHRAPILLTAGDRLSAPTADEIRRLGASRAWIIGGTGAVGPDVEADLRRAGITEVRRHEGASRVDTAASIARSLGGPRAFVASGAAWADAVAVSSLSALLGEPILLVGPDTLPEATRGVLAELGVTEVTVIGGAAAVSDRVVAELRATGATVRRVAGSTRYGTSLALGVEALAHGADPSGLWMATGSSWPDALTSGPAAAATGDVLLLVAGRATEAPATIVDWLREYIATQIVIVGGESSIGDQLVRALQAA